MPIVRRGPSDIGTSGTFLNAGMGQVSPGWSATVAGGVDWQEESVAFEFRGGGAGEAAAFEREHGMSDVSGDGVVPKRESADAGDVLLEGELGEAASVGPGAGEVDVVNGGHAVGGNEGDTLAKYIE